MGVLESLAASKHSKEFKKLSTEESLAVQSVAHKAACAIGFICGVDKTRYGEPLKYLENAYTQLDNKYPTTMDGAYTLLENWKPTVSA